MRYENYVIAKETKDYVLYRYGEGERDTHKCSKYLCVGGPFAGEYRTQVDTYEKYQGFNNANGKGRDRLNPASRHSLIWVSLDLL
jgi:hypothetical protein